MLQQLLHILWSGVKHCYYSELDNVLYLIMFALGPGHCQAMSSCITLHGLNTYINVINAM